MNSEIEKLLIEVRELREKADSIEVKALELGKLPKIGYDENKCYHTPTGTHAELFYDLDLADTKFKEYCKKIKWFKARKRIVDEIAKEKLKCPDIKCNRSAYINKNGNIMARDWDTDIAVLPKDMLFPFNAEGNLLQTLEKDYYTYFGVENGDCNE